MKVRMGLDLKRSSMQHGEVSWTWKPLDNKFINDGNEKN